VHDQPTEVEYEPPRLTVVGALHELTQASPKLCSRGKLQGPTDGHGFFPMANCSA
jgi:hypothetical protein